MSADNPETPFVEPPSGIDSREAQLHPFEYYREKRQSDPLWWNSDQQRWEVFSYDAVKHVLRDWETFSADTELPTDRLNILDDTIFNIDPPRHERLRSTVEPFFHRENIQSYEQSIRSIATDLLDDIVATSGGERIDIVENYAYALPIVVISDILGVPSEDRNTFREWCETVTRVDATSDTDLVRAQMTAGREIVTYLMEIIEERRDDPKDDLITRFTKAEIDGEPLSMNDILGFVALLLIAGNITTTGLITNAVRCYDDHPTAFESAIGSTSAVRRVLDEVIRYQSSVPAVSRVVARDDRVFERQVSEGDPVIVWLASANRDETVFDDPGAFVPDRSPNPHLGFGHGVHHCLGASLARLEARIALTTLFERVDALTVHTDGLEPHWSLFMHGTKSLPVTIE